VPDTAAIETIARAAVGALRGDAARSLESMRALGEQADPRIERSRLAVSVVAGRYAGLEHEATAVAEALAIAARRPDVGGRPTREWLGWLRYRQGRFAEAAEIHDRAEEEAPTPHLRLAALLAAGSAWLEAQALSQAAERAEQALRIARETRHALAEARAERILRAAAYRSGVATTPDEELIEAVSGLGNANLEAMVILTEAAIAWRAGDSARATTWADRARILWAGIGEEASAALAHALAAVNGHRLSPTDVDRLAAAASRCSEPGIAAQILALLARAVPERRDALLAESHRRLATASTIERGGRREILSLPSGE
jgi:Tfp pilus assembly protein PilF